MNIGSIIKNFLLSVIALIAPYLLNAFLKVGLPLILKSIEAVASGQDAQVQAAKNEIKQNWKGYVDEAKVGAQMTPSKVDDILFGYLANVDIDDQFIAKLFDMAVKFEQQFFRTA